MGGSLRCFGLGGGDGGGLEFWRFQSGIPLVVMLLKSLTPRTHGDRGKPPAA